MFLAALLAFAGVALPGLGVCATRVGTSGDTHAKAATGTVTAGDTTTGKHAGDDTKGGKPTGDDTKTKTTAGPSGTAAKVTFDTSMLAGATRGSVDVTRFEKGVMVLPGTYNVDVYLNRRWVGRMNVRFAAPKPHANAVACVSAAMLTQLGLTAHAGRNVGKLADPKACVRLDALIAGARMRFDMATLRLDVSVPQAVLGHTPRGYVSPAAWDAGVPALLMNYHFNVWRTDNDGADQTSAYLALDSGLNVGLWRLRLRSSLTWDSGRGSAPSRRQWHNIDAWARRAIPALAAQLTVGDSHTDGAVFDSIALRGVQLATDDRMRPPSRRGYAPLVRGEAMSNAKVVVRQNGVEIYQTTVPPGPFVINDLYPTGYGGALEVTVTEANGRRHSFEVPYASVSQLVRPGVTRFNVAVGQLRHLPFDRHPRVVQGTIQYGFNNRFTGYAGFQGSNGYAAALIGGAFNTPLGALALDITEAGVTLPGQLAHDGQSVRLTWSKLVADSRTRIGVAAYRYSTSGFLDLTDAAIARAYARRGVDTFAAQSTQVPTINGVPVTGPLTPAERAALTGTQVVTPFVPRGLLHQRNRFMLTLSQPLGTGGGTLYGNVSFRDYWNRNDGDTAYQIGYNNHIGRVSIGISAARTRDVTGRFDNRVHLSVSLPLGDTSHAPTFMANLDHASDGRSQAQAMLTGTAGRDDQFNWGATVSHANRGGGNAASVDAGYHGPHAVVHANVGKGEGYAQASFGMSGSLLATRDSITLGQPTGDTVALVHAPGAAGARVLNAPGVRLDAHGYAVVPYLAPYQRDTIRLSPNGLPLGVELDATSASVAPYAGAVVMVDFETRYGRAVIASIRRADGKLLPFGTEVRDANGVAVGMVGQGGRALLRVGQPAGTLSARWNGPQGAPQHCSFAYAIAPSASPSRAPARIRVVCAAVPRRSATPPEGAQ